MGLQNFNLIKIKLIKYQILGNHTINDQRIHTQNSSYDKIYHSSMHINRKNAIPTHAYIKIKTIYSYNIGSDSNCWKLLSNKQKKFKPGEL